MKHTPQSIQNKTDYEQTRIFRRETERKDPMELSARIYRESEPVVNTQSGKLRFAPAALFVAFIFGLAIWFIFNPKLDYSSSEKRYLQKFPEVSLSSVSSGDFGTEFESYFADHFPARNLWVGFNAYYALGTGNNGAAGVYNCSDGYLINKPVSVKNNVDKNVSAVIDFKQNLGKIPVTVMLAPSTGYVASDKLPVIHDRYNDDRYINNAKSDLAESGISFVDLRDSFKEAYENGEQRRDHRLSFRPAEESSSLAFSLHLSGAPASLAPFDRTSPTEESINAESSESPLRERFLRSASRNFKSVMPSRRAMSRNDGIALPEQRKTSPPYDIS